MLLYLTVSGVSKRENQPLLLYFQLSMTGVHFLTNIMYDIACVFFDFKKAFDSVSHHKMMEKLSLLDLPPSILSWLCGYLSGRHEFVLVNGEHSKSTLIRFGVPQGSVLGPLLFLLYINDITKLHLSDQSRLKLYADDILLYKPITQNTSRVEIQQDINRLFQSSQENMLSFNITKCKCMLLTKKRNTSRNNFPQEPAS